ncbi:MAG: amidohydrolase family protein [Actinomycetota bacterium]|nr:amidohydrolase family protein [Actinomycetota bacterium]
MRWESGKTRKNGDGIPWVDPHVHILPPRRMRGLIRWVKGFTPGFPVSEDISGEEILSDLRASEIPFFFNLIFPLWEVETADLNRFNRDLCAGIEEAIPFGSLHIDTPDKERETRRCLEEYGFLGMKLHPFAQRFPAFVPEMRPLFEVLEEHGKPLLVHTGFDDFYGMYMDLEAMEKTIRDFPRMQVVAVHSLFPRFELAYRWLEEYPNFWLDMTNTISCMRMYEELRGGREDLPPLASSLEVEAVEKNHAFFYRLFEDFPERIMYGTDFPAGFGYHPALLEDLRFFSFPRRVEEQLLFGTVCRLVSLCGGPDLAARLPGTTG